MSAWKLSPKNNDSSVIINYCKSTPWPWLTSLKWLLSYFNSPQWIPTPCFETKCMNCPTGHSKKNMTVVLKHLRCVLSEKFSLVLENKKKKQNFTKIINKCDWTNQIRIKYKYICICNQLIQQLVNCPVLIFSLACILIFVSDWQCCFTKFNKLITMPYFLFLILLFRNHADG